MPPHKRLSKLNYDIAKLRLTAVDGSVVQAAERNKEAQVTTAFDIYRYFTIFG